MPKVGNQAMCLNVAGASQENWANVILYDYTGDDNCVWWLDRLPLNKNYSESYPYFGKGGRTGNEARQWYNDLLNTYSYMLRNESFLLSILILMLLINLM